MNETRAQKLHNACSIFEGSKYAALVEALINAWSVNDTVLFDELFEKLPTNIQMLDSILEKIKGKKVFSTLKKTVVENIEDTTEALIGLSSLMTHVAIECRDSKEYRALLPDLHAKLGVLIRKV